MNSGIYSPEGFEYFSPAGEVALRRAVGMTHPSMGILAMLVVRMYTRWFLADHTEEIKELRDE